jgi:hypothetical protein
MVCPTRGHRAETCLHRLRARYRPHPIGLEECRAHFTKIAPDFLQARGFVRKQFICRKEGGVAGGVYMWETQQAAEAFYTGPWRDGIRARYGNDPKIQYFETVALTDKASGKAGAIYRRDDVEVNQRTSPVYLAPLAGRGRREAPGEGDYQRASMFGIC